MLVELGQRLTILAPTILFGLSSIWGHLSHFDLGRRLKVRYPEDKSMKFAGVTLTHFYQVFFAEALFLFIINGLILILDLSLPLEGVVLLLIGLAFAAAGLVSSLTNEEGSMFSLVDALITVSVAGGQFAVLTAVGVSSQNGVLAVLENPWIMFGFGFGVTFGLLMVGLGVWVHMLLSVLLPN